MLDERTLDPRGLAAELGALLEDPARLRRAAAASKAAGVDDGAERLADLVEEVARKAARGKLSGAAASNGAGA